MFLLKINKHGCFSIDLRVIFILYIIYNIVFINALHNFYFTVIMPFEGITRNTNKFTKINW